MRIVIDIEANSLVNPTKVWVIVCKDIDTGELHVFRPTVQEDDRTRFTAFASGVSLWVGHNILGYDLPALHSICGLGWPSVDHVVDTLILSKLTDYSRKGGHSLEQYGEEFGIEKNLFSDFTKYSQELEDRCARDAEINLLVYNKFTPILSDSLWSNSIHTEHAFQLIANDLHNNGFYFNSNKATNLLNKVKEDLAKLDTQIEKAFPPKQVLVREFTPKATKHGTISKTSVPRSLWSSIHEYSVGETYPIYRQQVFNPSSHKQVIEVLHEAGWKPIDKTTTHIDTERKLQQLKRSRKPVNDVDLTSVCDKLKILEKYGWKINENNLATLPDKAPAPSKLLAKRILLESRRRTLTEWISLVQDDGRIHGSFQGIGAWTHRMAHQRPNTANIPNDLDTQGNKKLLGKEMRSLWCAPKNRLLVGVDAEGIQLRIFAHYIDDPEFTDALIKGKKEDKTDPHSLNARILGDVCKGRAAAKRFIFALLLGAGLWKLSQILGCSEAETKVALDRLLQRYQGFARLKREVIPLDAKRGYFTGLDGRKVQIPGETQGEREHLAMSGYLQNGEAVVMKLATLKWTKEIKDAYYRGNIVSDEVSAFASQTLTADRVLERAKIKLSEKDKIILVNFVHDEWQTETPNDMAKALWVAEYQSRSLREVGEELKLKCPLAGSYWNDDIKDYTIGTNWAFTH